MGRGIRLQLSLTDEDRERIEFLLSGGTQEVRTVLRALALRQLDRGLSTPAVGALVGLAGKTVREIGQRQQVVALVCSSPSDGFARWTVRLLAEETVRRKIVPAIGREAIRVLLESHDLKPWREKNVVRGEA